MQRRCALPEGQGFVKQLRVGPQGSGDLRLVIDLAAPATPHSFAVAPNGATAIAWSSISVASALERRRRSS